MLINDLDLHEVTCKFFQSKTASFPKRKIEEDFFVSHFLTTTTYVHFFVAKVINMRKDLHSQTEKGSAVFTVVHVKGSFLNRQSSEKIILNNFPLILLRLDSNIESKSTNNTFLNIIEIFNKLSKKINIIKPQNLVVTSTSKKGNFK